VDDLFNLHHLPDQPNQDQLCVFVAYGPTRIFSKSIVSSQITGNEVLISYRKSDIWKTSLIGNIITDQVKVQVFGITNK
jgi:hypothetical protein